MPCGIFVVDADFVVQDGVEADVFEIGGLLHFAQVAAIAFAQTQDRPAGAEHLFPEMGEGMSGGSGIDFDGFGGLRGRSEADRKQNREDDYAQCCGFHEKATMFSGLTKSV